MSLRGAVWSFIFVVGYINELGGGLAEAAYDCIGGGGVFSGNIVTEMQGEPGTICATKCGGEPDFKCSLDVPHGVTAQPQCMLQDVEGASYCALLCQIDSQCPGGTTCKPGGSSKAFEVGVCVHPLPYMDWAQRSKDAVKVDARLPIGAGHMLPSVRIAKATAALRSLRHRFNIAKGDVDSLVVQELLTAASPSGNSTGLRGVISAIKKDAVEMVSHMEQGLPGLEREVQDTVWKIEHVGKSGVCSDLLRHLFICFSAYLLIGVVYKNQALGASGLDMIPHVQFWMAYPGLVQDGVKLSIDFVRQLVTGRSSQGFSDFDAPTHFGSSIDRDTFSNFEPSK